jgi:short-subunit dehydrogenase
MATTQAPAVTSPAPVVVITGASSGIGRATARALANRGAALVLTARDREALDEVSEECRKLGADTLAVPADVTDAQAVRAVAHAAIARFRRFDVWINNVGVGAVGRFDQVPLDAHRRVIETNLIGHLNGAHIALLHFRERGRGTLINMVSIGGWLSAPYAAAYSASKFALRGFGQSLRAELSNARRIHVCDVFPGFVDTPGMSHGANYTRRSVRPLPPLLAPELVAERIVGLIDRPRPVLTIGGAARIGRFTHTLAPELRGAIARRFFDFLLARARTSPQTEGNLFDVSRGHDVHGGFRGRSKARAWLAIGGAVGAIALVAMAARARRVSH